MADQVVYLRMNIASEAEIAHRFGWERGIPVINCFYFERGDDRRLRPTRVIKHEVTRQQPETWDESRLDFIKRMRKLQRDWLTQRGN